MRLGDLNADIPDGLYYDLVQLVCRVAQDNGARSGVVVYVLVTVHVPLARPGSVGHVQRKRLGVAGVVGNAARENLGGLQVPFG